MLETPLSRLQLTIVALLGVSFPLFCAVYLTPLLFSRSVTAVKYDRAMLGMVEAEATSSPKESVFDDVDGSADYLSFVSDQNLDPTDNQLFVVSFEVKLSQIPRQGQRQKLIYKYAADLPPYSGWALAIHRTKTSLRPEVYWQDTIGKGGWYTFNDVELDPNSWYRLTLLGKPKEFLSLYIEDEKGVSSLVKAEIAVDVDGNPSVSPSSKIRFLGGFDVADVLSPQSDGKLYVRSLGSNSGNFRAQIRDVLLGHTQMTFASVPLVKGVLRDGSNGLAKLLGNEGTSLWLDEAGSDRSRFARNPVVRSNSSL
jgi:hypothetical protein